MQSLIHNLNVTNKEKAGGDFRISSPEPTLKSGLCYSRIMSWKPPRTERLHNLHWPHGIVFCSSYHQSEYLISSYTYCLLSTCFGSPWRAHHCPLVAAVSSLPKTDPAPSWINSVLSASPHMGNTIALSILGASDELSQTSDICWCVCYIERPNTRHSITRCSVGSAE